MMSVEDNVGDLELDAVSIGSLQSFGDDMLGYLDAEPDDEEIGILLNAFNNEVDNKPKQVQDNAALKITEAFSESMNKSKAMFDEFSELNSAIQGVDSYLGVHAPTIGSVAAFADTLKETKAKFDEFLERTTAPLATDENQSIQPFTLESMAAFASTLKESMAKFDAFLERNLETPDESRDSKRRRDQYHERHPSSAIYPVSIRALSGDNLSSVEGMRHGYATASALNGQANSRSEFLKPSQQNQTWEIPELVLVEGTGSKMRRLESQNSYFHTCQPTEERSKNAAWGVPTEPLRKNQYAAMQMLLSGSSKSGGETKKSGWPAPRPTSQSTLSKSRLGGRVSSRSGRLSNSRSSMRSLPNMSRRPAQVKPNASWTAPNPASGVSSIEDMQRFVNAHAFFQGSTMTADSSTPNAAWPASKPTFENVTVGEIHRLASSGSSFLSQKQAPKHALGNVSMEDMQRHANSSVSFRTQDHSPKPAFASVTMEEMQRLANTSIFFPSQEQTPKPAFGSVTMEVMQHNASTGASFRCQERASKPAFASVSMEDMQRLANTSASFRSQEQAPKPAFGNIMEEIQDPASTGAFFPSKEQTPTRPAFASVIEDMQRLANSSASFHPQEQTRRPAFASVTLEDMQHLASTGASFPSQEQAAKPAFASSTMKDMQRLANSGASLTTHRQAPKPAFASVVMEDMYRLANRSASLPTHGQVSKPAFGNITVKDMQCLVNSNASLPTSFSFVSQARPTTKESAPQYDSQSASLQALKSAFGNVTLDGSGASLKSLVASAESEKMQASSNAIGQASKMHRLCSVNGSVEPRPVKNPSNDFVNSFGYLESDKTMAREEIQQIRIESSYFLSQTTSPQSSQTKNAAWPQLNSVKESQPLKLPAEVDANKVAEKLRKTMKKSSATQKALQDWDEENGLPRSHSQTMVSSSRSRKQLQEGKIIAKWDGSPLICTGTEFGKSKKSRASSKDFLLQSTDVLFSLVT